MSQRLPGQWTVWGKLAVARVPRSWIGQGWSPRLLSLRGEPANAGGRRRENSREGPWNRTDELGSLRRRVGTSFTVSLIQILPSHAMKSLPCECHDASPFPGVLTDSLSSMEVKHVDLGKMTAVSVYRYEPFLHQLLDKKKDT